MHQKNRRFMAGAFAEDSEQRHELLRRVGGDWHRRAAWETLDYGDFRRFWMPIKLRDADDGDSADGRHRLSSIRLKFHFKILGTTCYFWEAWISGRMV